MPLSKKLRRSCSQLIGRVTFDMHDLWFVHQLKVYLLENSNEAFGHFTEAFKLYSHDNNIVVKLKASTVVEGIQELVSFSNAAMNNFRVTYILGFGSQ